MVLRRFAHAEGGIPCSLRGGSKEAFSRCEGGVNAWVWVQREVGARHAAELPLHQHLLSAEGKLRLLPVAGREHWSHGCQLVPHTRLPTVAGPRGLQILGVNRVWVDFFLFFFSPPYCCPYALACSWVCRAGDSVWIHSVVSKGSVLQISAFKLAISAQPNHAAASPAHWVFRNAHARHHLCFQKPFLQQRE